MAKDALLLGAADIVQRLSGACLGAVIASAGAVAGPVMPVHFGPSIIVLLGYDLPLLPAIIGAIGVVATRQFAPLTAVEARISRTGRFALTGMMVLVIIALVMSGERRPLVITGLAGGLGYSGVAIFELLASGVKVFAGFAIEAFTRGAVSIIKSRGPKEGDE
jgi:hypothetical protein